MYSQACSRDVRGKLIFSVLRARTTDEAKLRST
jgi:hypothetical protein